MGFSPVTIREERVYVTTNVSESEDPLVTDSYILYSDINMFSPGAFPLIFNMDAIMQVMENIFNTQQGERLFRPTYGSDMRNLLFKPITPATSMGLKQNLLVAVEVWDQRIKVNRPYSSVTPMPDDNAYHIFLWYNVVGINEQNFAYEAVLAV